MHRGRACPDLAPPEFEVVGPVDLPFRYATFERCLSRTTCDAVLAWFEHDAPWHLSTTDFYEQYEFSCWDSDSAVASFLTSDEVIQRVSSTMSQIFGHTFEDEVSVVCHRLVAPQKIGIHNDFLAEQESHRMVIQLNRGLSDGDGGILMLFNSEDPTDIHRLLRPVNRSGLVFEISPTSNHAVSRIHGGIRYTLVYSLRASDQ